MFVCDLLSLRLRKSTVNQGRRWEKETCWWSWYNTTFVLFDVWHQHQDEPYSSLPVWMFLCGHKQTGCERILDFSFFAYTVAPQWSLVSLMVTQSWVVSAVFVSFPHFKLLYCMLLGWMKLSCKNLCVMLLLFVFSRLVSFCSPTKNLFSHFASMLSGLAASFG